MTLKIVGALPVLDLAALPKLKSRLVQRYWEDDDLSTLKDLAGFLREEESKKKKGGQQQDPNAPEYVAIVVEALDNAFDMIGRTGKDVLYTMLEERYELRTTDVATKPGEFMSALRALLADSALVIESYMLSFIAEKTQVRGWSLEDAVDKLKAAYRDSHPQPSP
jgi:hypothetical protein